jgi:RNA polymerase sigma-70 factor (ECF subfamily)
VSQPLTSRSLLARARDFGDVDAWKRLTDLYVPLIRRWVRLYAPRSHEIDDLVQDVMATLARELATFRHNERVGAFRTWLRTVTVHRLRASWQAEKGRPRAIGGDESIRAIEHLEDPNSPLSRTWDEEHDRHVAHVLLESIRLEFQPATWHAFTAQVREGRTAADVAAELGLSVNAALIAKSRVLKRLRQSAEGLLDVFV